MGALSRWSLFRCLCQGVSVQGVSVWGSLLRGSPVQLHAGGTHPAGMYSCLTIIMRKTMFLLARLESAFSLIWGSREIWEKGGGDTLALL